MPAGHHEQILFIDLHHSLDDDEDVNGGPANDKGRDHHQHHARDAPKVPVLLFRAGEQAYALEANDHQPVADGDDQDGNYKGKNEDADLGHGIPIPVWVWKF